MSTFNTLEVTESYLSLDSTQYAQVSVGATRFATFGNGTSLYGIIPDWNATNWEIECDMVFHTSNESSIKFLNGSSATNNIDFQLGGTGGNKLSWGTPVAACYLDGVSAGSNGTTAHPTDGAVHKVKLTGTTAVNVATILTRYSLDQKWSRASIFNLKLTDLDTPANSRFYPMDEPARTDKGDDIFYSSTALGSNLISTWASTFSENGTSSTWDGTKLTVVAQDGQSDHISIPISGLTIGKQYLYEIELDKVGATPHAAIDAATWGEEGWNGITWTTRKMWRKLVTATATSGLCRIYPAQSTVSGGAAGDTLEIYNISVREANTAGLWYNRVAGDIQTVYPDAIEYGQTVYLAIKYKVIDNTPGSGFNNLAGLGLANSTDNYSIYIPESNGQVGISVYKDNVKVSEVFGRDLGTTHVDGKEHIIVLKINSNGSYRFYVDSADTEYGGSSATNTFRLLKLLNLNGRAAGLGVASAKTNVRIFYAYLYNTLSPADIAALMQGEHPASVGNVRQGYNLAGDGDEINGGPALTPYNSPSFVEHVPLDVQRKIFSSVISSMIS